MLRTAAFAAVMLLAACAPAPRQNRPPSTAPLPIVGVLVNSTRGRCTWVLVGNQPRRLCAPRGKAPRDSVQTDTTASHRDTEAQR
ncbi:MAG: hypothetical protein AVDCRST_MAG68-4015 [uncultured Gemmatimonadetes bacterium]|uniref:Lipoprotein n=1 Tax=uncultured Gemmatimonadota bacterium TaxID=203437 RepID=A0A6J4M1K6_9BACT|nr:MAG: hypothetical protein AVDCRST_MAG68-4015 [uncultured Gemmatimonadota bacterium]